VLQTVVPAERHGYLTTRSARYSLLTESDLESSIFRYEYEREPDDPYPSAHFHISFDTGPLVELLQRRGLDTTVNKLHFPVGGRRFRPSLEDVVEFLIVEGLADAHDEWRARVRESRDKFYGIQLRAAVRENPDAALEVLREMRLIQ
jgi:hypothetical protein